MVPSPRRFPQHSTVEELDPCFVVIDATGTAEFGRLTINR
jgi:hypothetical protein